MRLVKGTSRGRGSSSPPCAEVDASAHLTFVERPRVAVCRHCKQAVRPDGSIEVHFRQTHKLKGAVLRAVVDLGWAAAYDGPLEDPHTCEIPPDGSPPLEELPVLDG
ncbi:hypothetical protein LZ32DRAFT_546536, partial [Colletotrichum eremochloae]